PDETGKSARYMIVGVLTVPVLELQTGEPPPADDQEGDPEERPREGEAEEHAGGVLSDEEFFADGGDEPDPELGAKELGEARANKGAWQEIMERDQEAWKAEAEQEFLPEVKLVEWVFVETLQGKGQQQVLGAISRMRAEAMNLGFSVRRLHSDRGREYNNAALKGWCAQHSIVKTMAFAEEHQGNGRVESTIGRIKAKARTFMEQGGAPVEEWPLAVQLAAMVLQNKARDLLHMPRRQVVPYNTKVQVVQRTWRRGAWHAVTVAAKTKGPSVDNDRGWVVVTSDGNFLTTSKLFPSAQDEEKIVVTYEGPPIDPNAPSRRVTGKSPAARKIKAPMTLPGPTSEADVLAQKLLEQEDFSPSAVAKLALVLSRTPDVAHGSQLAIVEKAEKGVVFFAGAFSFGGLTGMKNQAKEHPWVTGYLARYLSIHTSSPFATIGLLWNTEHKPHRDSHNQKGISNVVVPVVTSGGGLWVQDEGLSPDQRLSQEVCKEVSAGKEVKGRCMSYKSGRPVAFDASKWHASVKGTGQQLLVVGDLNATGALQVPDDLDATGALQEVPDLIDAQGSSAVSLARSRPERSSLTAGARNVGRSAASVESGPLEWSSCEVGQVGPVTPTDREGEVKDDLWFWYEDGLEAEDGEDCRFSVPVVASELKACACTPAANVTFRLESIPWKMKIDLESEAVLGAEQHRTQQQALETLEEEAAPGGNGGPEIARALARLGDLEGQVVKCTQAAWELLPETGSTVVEGVDKLATHSLCTQSPAVRSANGLPQNRPEVSEEHVGGEEEFLQTRLVSVEEVKRDLGICTERYWQLERAMYGLDVSPKNWVLFRNQTLESITALTDGTPVRCRQLPQDANLWEVKRETDGQLLAFIGIYVDDLAVVAPSHLLPEVMATIRRPWETSAPETVHEKGDVSFAGYELRIQGDRILMHQRSYIREMLKQWEIDDEATAPAVKEPPVVTSREQSIGDLTRRAQAIAGQLLWVSTHTRPDVVFAVQNMCQMISTDPAGACDAGFVIMKYLKRTLEHALSYGPPPNDHGLWNELQFKRGERLVEVFSDASFCADEASRSYQCAMLFWGGDLVMWAGGRQSLIAASAAEAELIGMVEAYHMGRAFLPTIEVLSQTPVHPSEEDVAEEPIVKVLYGDNSAAIQLCQLDAGAWRTRHLRLRGAILRQATQDLGWRIAHLPGLYMPADIGTKILGPARFADLLHLLRLHGVQPGADSSGRPKPQIAQAVVIKVLLAVLVASLVQPADAQVAAEVNGSGWELVWVTLISTCVGFGLYLGAELAKGATQACCPPRVQAKTCGSYRPPPEPKCSSEDLDATDLERPLIEGPSRGKEETEAHKDQTAEPSSASPGPFLPLDPTPSTYKDIVERTVHHHERIEDLQRRLAESERFGQEYVDRCTYLREVLAERCEEVRRFGLCSLILPGIKAALKELEKRIQSLNRPQPVPESTRSANDPATALVDISKKALLQLRWQRASHQLRDQPMKASCAQCRTTLKGGIEVKMGGYGLD
ncbi:GIP, partial [Symbiodinium sp. CCMP2456]